MRVTRADFLKGLAALASLALIRSPGRPDVARAAPAGADLAMLVDVSRCIGCWWCYAACKHHNGLEETTKPGVAEPPELSPDTWTTLRPVRMDENWSYLKHACMHCADAACVKVCPSGALSYNELGFVQYEREKCIGCGYCVEFCPFEVPRLEDNRATGVGLMSKCTFCKDRVARGEQPACAEACPTGAIQFGDRSQLLEEGRQRVRELVRSYPRACLYGEHEMGGLHVLYVLPDQPSAYGLPEERQLAAAAIVQEDILRPFAWIAWGAAAAGLTLNVLVARLRQIRAREAE